MKRIKLTFPDGTQVKADLLDESEPDLVQSLWAAIEQPVKLVCYGSLSNGSVINAYMRPSREPVETMRPGRHPVSYGELCSGEILWDGTRLLLVYGPCTEPGTAGAVTARITGSHLKNYEKACLDIGLYTYHNHKPSILISEREAE